jgi:hypothetical protein
VDRQAGSFSLQLSFFFVRGGNIFTELCRIEKTSILNMEFLLFQIAFSLLRRMNDWSRELFEADTLLKPALIIFSSNYPIWSSCSNGLPQGRASRRESARLFFPDFHFIIFSMKLTYGRAKYFDHTGQNANG